MKELKWIEVQVHFINCDSTHVASSNTILWCELSLSKGGKAFH
ncbi:hypothetical protein MTR67_035602 [Solanum verrucosum]|uniref:Uncharacterized protein n=1 Tax=Solanum verrucosum TaxID=315347 RepID=A0AAF0UA69_SOLVR|nr:hypothetical protein MTR67_035602 [Solanum verrucosum]